MSANTEDRGPIAPRLMKADQEASRSGNEHSKEGQEIQSLADALRRLVEAAERAPKVEQPRVASGALAPYAEGCVFTTERGGSVYRVLSSGVTQRNKGASLGHEDVGDKGVSEKTFYVTPEMASRIDSVYATSPFGEKYNDRLKLSKDGELAFHFFQRGSDGNIAEKFAIVPTEERPQVGLQPVEIGRGWSHIGSRIDSVTPAAGLVHPESDAYRAALTAAREILKHYPPQERSTLQREASAPTSMPYGGVRINTCNSNSAWYRGLVGRAMPLCRPADKDVDVFWAHEPHPVYKMPNIIAKQDAQPVLPDSTFPTRDIYPTLQSSPVAPPLEDSRRELADTDRTEYAFLGHMPSRPGQPQGADLYCKSAKGYDYPYTVVARFIGPDGTYCDRSAAGPDGFTLYFADDERAFRTAASLACAQGYQVGLTSVDAPTEKLREQLLDAALDPAKNPDGAARLHELIWGDIATLQRVGGDVGVTSAQFAARRLMESGDTAPAGIARS